MRASFQGGLLHKARGKTDQGRKQGPDESTEQNKCSESTHSCIPGEPFHSTRVATSATGRWKAHRARHLCRALHLLRPLFSEPHHGPGLAPVYCRNHSPLHRPAPFFPDRRRAAGAWARHGWLGLLEYTQAVESASARTASHTKPASQRQQRRTGHGPARPSRVLWGRKCLLKQGRFSEERFGSCAVVCAKVARTSSKFCHANNADAVLNAAIFEQAEEFPA